MVLEGRYPLPSLLDLGFVEVLVAKFLLGLSIHKRLVLLDEVQGLFDLLQTVFLETKTGGGWTKQVIC
jgi:hypothetical protein